MGQSRVSVWKISSETAAILHFFQVFSNVSNFLHISMLLYVLEQIELHSSEKNVRFL